MSCYTLRGITEKYITVWHIATMDIGYACATQIQHFEFPTGNMKKLTQTS